MFAPDLLGIRRASNIVPYFLLSMLMLLSIVILLVDCTIQPSLIMGVNSYKIIWEGEWEVKKGEEGGIR